MTLVEVVRHGDGTGIESVDEWFLLNCICGQEYCFPCTCLSVSLNEPRFYSPETTDSPARIAICAPVLETARGDGGSSAAVGFDDGTGPTANVHIEEPSTSSTASTTDAQDPG